jgi:uroporphyrin-3 C-methyltransferase
VTDASDPIPDPRPPHRGSLLPWLLLALLVAFAAWRGWAWWQARQQAAGHAEADAAQRLSALETRFESLRREQRSQAQRLQQADATNRLLRDELLGLGQRAALLEDSVSRLADPDRHGAQALRLDEVEMLLSTAQQRLQLAGDVDGARRAYVLAAGTLGGIDDPAYLSLRQTLAQERAALDALGADPARAAAARLDVFAARLEALPPPSATPFPAQGAWWQRLLGRVVDVQPSDRAQLRAPGERAAAMDALQTELTLARAALERRDTTAWRAALARIERWLPRLWADSPQLRAQRATLATLRTQSLALPLPMLGSTLGQLRTMRAR